MGHLWRCPGATTGSVLPVVLSASPPGLCRGPRISHVCGGTLLRCDSVPTAESIPLLSPITPSWGNIPRSYLVAATCLQDCHHHEGRRLCLAPGPGSIPVTGPKCSSVSSKFPVILKTPGMKPQLLTLTMGCWPDPP